MATGLAPDKTSYKLWSPASFLTITDQQYDVIVLNQPIENRDIFLSICSRAYLKIAADGGANRIRDLVSRGEDEDKQAFCSDNRDQKDCEPDYIIGDLDSIRADVKTWFEYRGVIVHHDPDQYSTDFTKCLRFLSEKHSQTIDSTKRRATIVFGGLGGRADQAFAQLHQLYSASQDESLSCGDIYLFSTEAVMFLLHTGENVIETLVSPDALGENVGIIPVGKPAVISTHGLEWDVVDWPTEFGTQVSTSNHIRSNFVVVTTNERVLFTVELAHKP